MASLTCLIDTFSGHDKQRAAIRQCEWPVSLAWRITYVNESLSRRVLYMHRASAAG